MHALLERKWGMVEIFVIGGLLAVEKQEKMALITEGLHDGTDRALMKIYLWNAIKAGIRFALEEFWIFFDFMDQRFREHRNSKIGL